MDVRLLGPGRLTFVACNAIVRRRLAQGDLLPGRLWCVPGAYIL